MSSRHEQTIDVAKLRALQFPDVGRTALVLTGISPDEAAQRRFDEIEKIVRSEAIEQEGAA